MPPIGLVPLHKLSQWLAYSLIEPLQGAGIEVTDIDGLTGLAEYRNGGLFIDTGVLRCATRIDAQRQHSVDSDAGGRMARAHRRAARPPGRVGAAAVGQGSRDAPARPNPAGRNLGGRPHDRQRSCRPDGSPPLKVVSDGTVF